MYRLLRNLHLTFGLTAILPLLLFAVTGGLLGYNVYNPPALESERVLTDVPATALASPRAMAGWLMTQGIRGALTHVEQDDDDVTLRIERPGRAFEVRYGTDEPRVEVSARRHRFLLMLGYMHETAGLTDPYWGTRAWGWLALVSSIALVLLALSGLVMWFQRRQDRRTGAIVLAAGLLWGLGLLVAIRLG